MLSPDFLLSLSLALVASVSGSLHCVAMCGPMRMLLSGGSGDAGKYQSGRLISYVFLGLTAGSVGAWLPPWAPLLFILLFFVMTYLPPAPGTQLRNKILRLASASPFSLGLASGLLPCGLLHGWLLVAASSRTPLMGAALLTALWLGTIPALEAAPRILRQPLAQMRSRFPKAIPLGLLVLALAPAIYRSSLSLVTDKGKQEPSCHHSLPELPKTKGL